jgi:signal transduction histidine kinase
VAVTYARRVAVVRWWQSRPVTARDGLLAVLLALLAFAPPLAHQGTRLGDLPERPADLLALLAALAQSLPLAARRRWPAAVLAFAVAGFALQDLRGYQSFASLGLIVALYSAGAYQPRYRRVVVAALTAGYVLLAAAEHAAGSPAAPVDFAIFYLCLAAGWLLGSWVRVQRQRAAELRRLAAAEVRTAERARIARELHDVVTHHVTAMVVQAGAAPFLAADPAKLDTALGAISETGRRALTELRDLLGVLDPAQGEPVRELPDLGQVAALVAQARAAGQPVEFGSRGRLPEMGAGRELAAYRVVQEALTNALKYGYGKSTDVRLDYRADGVLIMVTNDGPGRSDGPGGSGRGLAGLRERVELFGGTLTAGPDGAGGFAVHAHIPKAAHD